MGLSQHVHFSWARTQGHPADVFLAQSAQAVRSVVHPELTHDIQDIDGERRARVGLLRDMACALKE